MVKQLGSLPDDDIRAMTVYLGSFNDNVLSRSAQDELAIKLEKSRAPGPRRARQSAHASMKALVVCHQVGGAPLFGSRPSLALNSNVHSAAPHNLIQVVLHGITSPVSSDLGYMPGFKDSMTDDQVTELVSYLRQQFAPDKAPWADVHAAVSRVRQTGSR